MTGTQVGKELTKSALDSDGDVWNGVLHCLAALSNQVRLQHHGGSETSSTSHSLAWAAAVEVDFVIAILGNNFGGGC